MISTLFFSESVNIKMFHGTKKSAPGVSNIKSKFESDKGGVHQFID